MEELRVLLLDDVQTTNYIHNKFLDRTIGNVRVNSFQKGMEALEYLSSVPLEEYPHWLFVDINMPSMNCWSFFQKWIDLSLPFRDESRIYLLTTSVTPADKARQQNHAFIRDIIYKPLHPRVIRKVYTEYSRETGFRLPQHEALFNEA